MIFYLIEPYTQIRSFLLANVKQWQYRCLQIKKAVV